MDKANRATANPATLAAETRNSFAQLAREQENRGKPSPKTALAACLNWQTTVAAINGQKKFSLLYGLLWGFCVHLATAPQKERRRLQGGHAFL
jgi:hypothetical protein